ncbi:hypothetical protein AGABI2DRAFT_221721 [Agaricus bisporus var. bisporus H97]|uniref:hypothetical protein n=1 Tax=Agaricus bisporus var. bisporus (strain H97 / ATCC MYA-4626 / FGSC 10389) TaxID=936046 RepID=UPI00029F7052|nr:hypothetical protein AGABI2DRAFT_221721 [Agaricus bisporus var. bisporus H97]EKV47516.1 hypothetical protein AGABI2DRAFT_221721 [Agaricus bisporus var. bisporus H97]
MFARFTRIPLHRSIHTQAARPHSLRYARAALGTSAVAVAYLTWRSLSDPIALDSAVPTQSLQKPTVSSKPPSKASVTSPPPDTSIPEATPTPNPELSTDDPSHTNPDTDRETPENKSEGEKEGEGEGEEGSSSDGTAQGGAYNPETGEINWDCPCLGGMAHGPCGPEFREAFSCFVFSEVEPKGIDCVEKFKGMQDCFRRHPEVYGDEIMDDDEEEEAAAPAGTPEKAPVADELQENASSDAEASIPQPKTPPTP